MAAPSIGLFAYGTSPLEHLRPLQVRALLAEAAFRGTELVAFSAADCDPANDRIEAERFIDGEWRRGPAPIPPVVHSLTDPVRPRHAEIAAWLAGRTRLIVQNGPDKLALARLMEASPLAGYVIPFTRLDQDSVEDAIARVGRENGGAVVKPVDGMRGGGIQVLRRHGDEWILQRPGEAHAGSLAEMVRLVAKAIAGRMRYRDYIVQPFIDTTGTIGLPSAIRIDLAKGSGDLWQVIRQTARVGATGRMTTNVASGGAQMKVEPYLATRPVRPPEALQEDATALAFAVAGLIDASPDFSLSEVGVDIVLDPDDRLWLIEANAYPMGIWNEHPRAVQMIDYALWLTETAAA